MKELYRLYNPETGMYIKVDFATGAKNPTTEGHETVMTEEDADAVLARCGTAKLAGFGKERIGLFLGGSEEATDAAGSSGGCACYADEAWLRKTIREVVAEEMQKTGKNGKKKKEKPKKKHRN